MINYEKLKEYGVEEPAAALILPVKKRNRFLETCYVSKAGSRRATTLQKKTAK